MTTEAITSAIRSVLGDYASPEKIRELDAVLRPIYHEELVSPVINTLNIIEEWRRAAERDRAKPKWPPLVIG